MSKLFATSPNMNHFKVGSAVRSELKFKTVEVVFRNQGAARRNCFRIVVVPVGWVDGSKPAAALKWTSEIWRPALLVPIPDGRQRTTSWCTGGQTDHVAEKPLIGTSQYFERAEEHKSLRYSFCMTQADRRMAIAENAKQQTKTMHPYLHKACTWWTRAWFAKHVSRTKQFVAKDGIEQLVEVSYKTPVFVAVCG